jgi:threonine/homoserine/homoserine lactone efflux protein
MWPGGCRITDVLYLRGIAIGFAIAAPIGPVGLLCIRKALADGRLAAVVAGLGAALADTFFGAVVGLGLNAVSLFVADHQAAFKVVGGMFMVVVGAHTWRAAAFAIEPAERGLGMGRDFVTTFLITITNPATILGVVGVFAALGSAAQPADGTQAWMLVGGIFSGSTLWWLVLANLAAALRSRLTPNRMRVFNHLSGALLLVFAAVALGSLVF